MDIKLSKIADSSDLNIINKDIVECEKIVNSLISDLAQVDSSIQEYKRQFYNVASDCFGNAEKMFNGINEKRFNANKMNDKDIGMLIGSGLSAGAGIITATAGFISGKIKEHQAKKEFNQKMDTLLVQKKQIANEKLDNILSTCDKMELGVFAQTEKLFSGELTKSIDSTSIDCLENKLSMFKKAFGMVLKTRLLSDSLKYVIAEMRAWKEGEHNSGYSIKTLNDLFASELDRWPQIFGVQGWSKFISSEYNKKDSIRIPVAFIFSNPVLMENYVGISLPKLKYISGKEADEFNKEAVLNSKIIDKMDCSGEYFCEIVDIPILDVALKPIIQNNPYYRRCSDIAKKMYKYPKEPKGFGLGDLVIIIAAISGFIIYMTCVRKLMNPGFLKFFLTILPFIVMYVFNVIEEVCIDAGEYLWAIFTCIPYAFSSFRNNLPYKQRLFEYNRRNREAEEKLIKAKNNINTNQIILL